MTMTTAKLRWSESEAPIAIASRQQLDWWLDRLSAATSAEYPSIIDISIHGYEVMIGVGLPQSFIHVEHDSGEPPYMVTVGDDTDDGTVVFYLYGDHHTEIAFRHLIPTAPAREVLRAFFNTGRRSSSVEWEEI